MITTKHSSVFSLALLLAIGAAEPLAASLAVNASAQSPLLDAFTLATSVPQGTPVRIVGSSSMGTVNQTLKQRFEKQFPETQVRVENRGTPAALQAVLEGKADLAAIGRPLTPQEEAKGLVAVPVGRDKIAIAIGSNNPFSKSLDINQFAKIFRGEIKNWSEVGGAGGAIRLVDRPDSNDTRQAFRNYPAFKSGKFQAGANAQKVSDDSTRAVVQNLGKNGISYLPANQVRNQPGVKAVLMHGTAPTSPRYPFSQSLFYVYKGATANPAAAAFLGYATAAAGQQAVKQAGVVEGAAAVGGTPASNKAAKASLTAPANQAQTPNDGSANDLTAQVPASREATDSDSVGIPLWLWFLLTLGGVAALIWVLGKDRGGSASPQAYRDPNADFSGEADFPSGFDPLPSESRDAELTGWDVPNHQVNGSEPLNADNSDWSTADPANLDANLTLDESERSFRADDRDSTELLANLEATGDPSPNSGFPNFGQAAGATGAGAAAWSFLGRNDPREAAVDHSQPSVPPVETQPSESRLPVESQLDDLPIGEVESRLVLTPRDSEWAYAHWDIPRSRKAEVQRQGGERLALRLYDVTGLDVNAPLPDQYQQFDCGALSLSCDVPIPASDRTYIAELGYLAIEGQWLRLERSAPVWIAAHERMG